MRLFVALSLSTVLVLSTIAACGEPIAHGSKPSFSGSDPEVSSLGHAEPVRPFLEQKEQAAQAAVPEASAASRPVSAILITHCRKIIGLGFIDGAGGYHDVPLEGLTKEIVLDMLQSVPADRIAGYVLPCGGTDGTPI